MVTLLTGCGSKPQDTQSQNSENGATEGAAAVDRSEQLVIYTNGGTDGRAEWLQERAAKEGYNVQVVNIGGSDLTNRLIAEKNNSQVDLVYGLNAIEYEKLKKEDLLLKYEPSWVGEVDLSLGDPDGYYYPTVVQPLVLMYNNELKNPPADWTDLVDEQYANQFTLFPLGGGTGKTIYASILARYLDDKGELGVSDEGWNVIKQIFKNGHFQVEGEDSAGAVINASIPMSTMWGSGVLQHQLERDYKFGIMSPEVGVPYVVEQTVIISKSKKAALAKDFIDWFGSPELQLEWSQKFGTIPAAKVAQEQTSDDIKEFMGKVHSQEIDWGVVAENIDQWVEKAELEYVH